jgi:thiol:disulfide interchange protein DsbD
MAAYFIRPLLSEAAAVFLLGAVALAAALHLGWLDHTTAAFRGFPWLKTMAALGGVILATFLAGSWALLGPGVNWQPYSDQLLEEARQAHKPVIIDFSAAWCTPCRALEEITFHQPDVVARANRDFVMIKVDLTQKGNPFYTRILGQYQIKGVPTLVFLDGQGKERADLRLVDFLPPEQMLPRLAAVAKQ